MEWGKIVGVNVRRLRVERKLTQEQLAHEAEIDLTYVGGIERGARNPSVNVLGRLAASLGVHPRELLDEESSSD
jgi:transcriptional regulator with XRE-family HTH domain